ncbi:MAG: tetratricopeptide repeat protein [Candidatus Eisenbacteria bacterium]
MMSSLDSSSISAILVPAVILLLLIGVVLVVLRLRRSPEPRSRYVEALNALLEGDDEAALRDLRQTVQTEPTNTDAYLRLGNLLRKRGHWERALRIHRDLDVETFFRKKLSPEEKRRIREAIADDLLAARRTDEALGVLGDLLGRNKENRKIRAKMISIHERSGHWDKAYELYKEGLKLQKEHSKERLARYRSFCGASYLESGNTEYAKQVFLETLRLDEDNQEALYRLGEIYFDGAELDQAILYWERFHMAAPEHAWMTYERFETALYETGNLNHMEEVYSAVLAKAPSEVRTLLALSTFHARRGEDEKAIGLARRAVEGNLSSAAARSRFAVLVGETRPPEEAVEEIVGFLKKNPPPAGAPACSRCGYRSEGAFWRCPQCLMWNTLVSDPPPSSPGSS